MSENRYRTIARPLYGGGAPGAEAELPEVGSYAAIGDSFTAGTASEEGARWADRLAASLRRREPDLVYRNLASEGATSAAVLEQVGEALQLEPDLATVICGANDVLESVRPDPDAFAARLAEAFGALLSAVPGILIVTATIPERWRFLEMGPRTRERVARGTEEVNARIRALASERRIACLDVAAHPGLGDPENFSDDGLHPSSLGHARATFAFESLLQAHAGPQASR